jgi:hypothetical protein
MDREMFVDAVINATGLPYKYGGNGSDAVDCSGLIVMCMRKRWPDYSDKSAKMLYNFYKKNEISPDKIVPGCLLFYSRFGHVVACIRTLGSGILVLQGANGGSPQCLTPEDAYLKKAIVQPVLARVSNKKYYGFWESAFCGVVDPFSGVSNG